MTDDGSRDGARPPRGPADRPRRVRVDRRLQGGRAAPAPARRGRRRRRDAHPVRGDVRRPADVRRAVAPPRRDRRPRPAPRPADRAHRHRRHRRRHRRGPGDRPLAGRDGRGIADDAVPRPASRRRRRWSSRRRWTATCGRTRRRATTSRGCAREFGYRVVEPGDGPARVGPERHRPARRARRHRRRGRRGGRRRADPPARRRRPAAVVDRLGAFDLEGRRDRRHRRRHRGGHRPRAVHRQPEHRADGRSRSPRPRSPVARA